MFRYGERVRDTVTGYTGKVTGRTDYYGRKTAEYCLECLNGGITEEWIEESRLEPVLTEHKVHIPEMVEEIPLGTTKKDIEKNLSALFNEKA